MLNVWISEKMNTGFYRRAEIQIQVCEWKIKLFVDECGETGILGELGMGKMWR